MASSPLQSWVARQYREVGFGKDGKGSFIGKSALKQRLINSDPKNKLQIRQLVNAYVSNNLQLLPDLDILLIIPIIV